MRFLWIEMQNFMAFGQRQRLPLDRRGLVAVLGQNRDAAAADSNGAAKSSTLEGIVWVLFGKTMRGLSADEVINNRAKKECVVTLALEDDASNVWEVTRSRGVKEKRSNDAALLCNGQPPPNMGGISVAVQDQIETLIGMDKETFVHAVLMSYGSKPFSEMADGGQKSVVEAILNIEQYAHGRDKINARSKQRQNELAVVNADRDRTAQQLETRQAHYGKLVQSRDAHGILIKQRRIELFKKKADCEEKIEEQYTRTGLAALLDDDRELEETITTYRKQDDEVHRKTVAITREVGKKRTELTETRASLWTQRRMMDAQCSNINELAGKPCPTCNRLYDTEQADTELGAYDSAIKEIDEKLVVMDEAFTRLQEVEDKLLEELHVQTRKLRHDITQTELQQRMVREKIQQRSAVLQLITQLEQQAFHIADEIEKLDDDANPYEHLVVEAEKEINDLQLRQRTLGFKQRALDVEIKHLLFWDRGFGNQGIKSYVIESALPFLTERAQHYIDIMSGGDMTIKFAAGHVQKNKKWVDEFTITVENNQGADVYKGNSDGEKGRINLCIGWALGDLAAARAKKSIRFKALDEPFNHLDETGEDLVMKFLHTVVSDYETILCITHSDHLKNQFPRVVTIVKEGGYARVEE